MCQLALDYLKEIFCNKPLLQFSDPNKTYILYTDASNNAYSGVLCQPIDSKQDIRPVAYFSGTFTVQNKNWYAMEKEAYAVLKNMQHFNYYLWGTKCTLRCNHKLLEPFLTRGMKIAKLDRWAMLLQEYDIKFVHIKGKDNILADAISRLCTINIYKTADDTDTAHIAKFHPNEIPEQIHLVQTSQSPWPINMSSDTLCSLQKQDKFCKHKAHEIHLGVKNTFYLDNNGILKWSILVNNIEVCTTVIPIALTNILIHEFHNCRGHQGYAIALNASKRRFWWKGMRTNVKYHISNCVICSKILPNISCHLQLHLEIPRILFTCIAIVTTGKLPITSSGNKYACTYINMLTLYVVAVPLPDKTADSVIEAYLSGILSRAGASMVCLSDNGSELKNK